MSAAVRLLTYDQIVSGGYPSNREADVVLHDGSTVHLRPVRSEDGAVLRDFFTGLSAEARAFRFPRAPLAPDLVVALQGRNAQPSVSVVPLSGYSRQRNHKRR